MTRKTDFFKCSVHFAVQDKDIERLEELVRCAPPKYFQNREPMFIRHCGALAPCHLLVHLARNGVENDILYQILRLLVQGGADFNVADPHTFQRALHMAVASPQIDAKFIETMIVEAGADVNATQGLSRITPLEVAMENRNFEAMACLIDKGADWTVLPNTWITKRKRLCDEEDIQFDDHHVVYDELNLFLAHSSKVGDAILRRKRKTLTETAIGLCSMDLPVLCVVEIASWLIEDFLEANPTALVCWNICKTVKHY